VGLQRSTKSELIIKLKTAKAFGLIAPSGRYSPSLTR
jgi:hypothetical protein